MSNSINQNRSVTERRKTENRSFSLIESIDRQDRNLSTEERKRRIQASNRIALAYWQAINTAQHSTVSDESLAVIVPVLEPVKADYQAYLESLEIERSR